LPELRITAAEAIRALKKLGFRFDHQTGSHIHMKKQTPEGELTCTVPNHKGILPIGTVYNIMRQARVTRKQFIAALKG
jgi:predicted RNA binding protein YcfA (HicA-like mRNA interferase family)